MYNKGEIVLVDLGTPPNEIIGHEQAYRRPCLVLANFKPSELLIILPITSKKQPKNSYSVAEVKKGSGLSEDSYVLTHQIRTISYDRVIKTLGKMSASDLSDVKAVLATVLDLL